MASKKEHLVPEDGGSENREDRKVTASDAAETDGGKDAKADSGAAEQLSEHDVFAADVETTGGKDVEVNSGAAEQLSERDVFAADAETTGGKDVEVDSGAAEQLSERDVFAADVETTGGKDVEVNSGAAEQLSERDVFAADDDFYKALTQAGKPNSDKSPREPQGRTRQVKETHRIRLLLEAVNWFNAFSTSQKALLAGIAAVAVILVFALLQSGSAGPNKAGAAVAKQPTVNEETVIDKPAEPIQRQFPGPSGQPKPAVSSTEPVSLKAAESLYMQKDYYRAYAVYDTLAQNIGSDEQEQLLKDFLDLKMAFCLMEAAKTANLVEGRTNTDNVDRAANLFKTASQSCSPAVRVVANYNLTLLELDNRRFLNARRRAYETLALIGGANFENRWYSLVQCDCHFIVAECLTRVVLGLCDADKSLPKGLWDTGMTARDPFVNMNEEQLRVLLASGWDKLSRVALSPYIRQTEQVGTSEDFSGARWCIVCRGASLQELLARFAANAGLDVRWFIPTAGSGEAAEDTFRKRPVTLYMPAVTTRQFPVVAAGSVGLLARVEQDGLVSVHNPADYRSLSEHISVLSRQAVSLWRRFLLGFHSDQRAANAHFAIALLEAQGQQSGNAIAEYKLVANRFAQSPAAPYALLHSSQLKSKLHDYTGACEDLSQLVERYPQSELSPQAYLHLAESNKRMGNSSEAARLYRKIYTMGYSAQSQAVAALGAGTCSLDEGDYEGAAKWLTRYVNLARDRRSEQFYNACFLLGKANLALGKPDKASEVLEYALARYFPRDRYIEVLSAAVEARMQQEHFVEALKVLQGVHSWEVSRKQYTELLILKAGVLRAMGLVDKAIATIGDRAEYERDPQLKARISLELAKCCIAGGDLEQARQKLGTLITFVEPGPLANEIRLELAQVCLRLDWGLQTVSLCRQVLDSGPPDAIERRARRLLSSAYNRQKEYDKAALALAEQL